MRSSFILFAIIFLAMNGEVHAGLEYQPTKNGDCVMIDEGKIMRKVEASFCATIGENKSSFSSLDNSPREAVKESGRSPSLEIYYKRRASHQ